MIPDTAQSDRQLQSPPPGSIWRAQRGWIFGLIGLIVVSLVLTAWLDGTPSVRAERVRLATVTRGDLTRDAQVNGRVVAAVSPTLYAPAAGMVSLRIQPGDAVNIGDVLAQLDSPELRAELRREQSLLDATEVEIERAKIQSEQQKLNARKNADEAELATLAATRDRERIARACAQGVIPKVECLRSDDALKSAQVRSQHAAHDASLESKSVGLDYSARRKQLERQRLVVAELQRRVDALKLRAPVAGIVGSVAVADRAQVTENTALLTVVDLTRLEVELEIPESYVEDIGLGLTVEVDFGQAKQNGVLSSIAPEVTNNRVLARVRFAQQPQGLRQNQRVHGRVLLEHKPNVLMIARGPFFEQLGGRAAFVLRDGLATRQSVQFGASAVTAIEIQDGLKPGDQVVISGFESIGDAKQFRIKP